jgi:hypothetical protein
VSRCCKISRAAEPAYVGDNHGELAVGVLEDGLQPIGQPRSLVDEVNAVAGEIA